MWQWLLFLCRKKILFLQVTNYSVKCMFSEFSWLSVCGSIPTSSKIKPGLHPSSMELKNNIGPKMLWLFWGKLQSFINIKLEQDGLLPLLITKGKQENGTPISNTGWGLRLFWPKPHWNKVNEITHLVYCSSVYSFQKSSHGDCKSVK